MASFLRELGIAIVLVAMAAFISLLVPVPAHGAGSNLKLSPNDLTVIYEKKGHGWVLLSKINCPAFIQEKVSRHKGGAWFLGHEYHYPTKQLQRLCWRTLDGFTFEDGTQITEAVAYVQYASGEDGVLELTRFRPYVPGKDGSI